MPETVASCLYALTTGDPEKVIATWKADMTGSRRLAVAQFAKAQKGDSKASKDIAEAVARYQRQSAADARAPNRKPRVRASSKAVLCSVRKQSFVEALRLGKTEQEAAEFIHVDLPRVRVWRHADADFAAAWDGAQKYRNDVVSGILQGGLTRAAEVMVETLEHQDEEVPTQAAKLRLDAASRLLKGHGLLIEKTETELKANINGSMTVAPMSINLPPEVWQQAMQALVESGAINGVGAAIAVSPN